MNLLVPAAVALAASFYTKPMGQRARPIRLPTDEIQALAVKIRQRLLAWGLPKPKQVIAEEWLTLPNVKGVDVDVEIKVVGSPKFDFSHELVRGALLQKRHGLAQLLVVYINTSISARAFSRRPASIIDAALYRVLAHELTHAADLWSGKGSGVITESEDAFKRHHHNHPAEIKSLMRDVATQAEPAVRSYLAIGMPFNDAVRYALEDSKWVNIAPHMTARNRKTLLKGVYTHLRSIT